MSFQTVLFDLDGTLSESAPGITSSVQYALLKMGIEETDQKKLEAFIGPPLNFSFPKYYGFDPAQTSLAIQYYRERYNTKGVYETRLYPGMRKTLDVLYLRGITLAVASSKPKEMVDKVLESLSIGEYFTCVVGSLPEDELKNRMGMDHKSFMILLALTKLGMTGEDRELSHTIMVGDTRFDILGAKANRIASCGVLFGYGTKEELKEAGADYIAQTPASLLEILL